MRRLYIIGNGFDMAHGLQTSYWNFREFLQQKYHDFLYRFEKVYGFEPLDDTEYGYGQELQKKWDDAVFDKLWSRFEQDMALPDVEAMIGFSESVVGDLDLESGNTGIKDTMDEYWKQEYGFINNLQRYLKEWVSQIDLSEISPLQQKLLNNNVDSFFNFNYTAVLEMVYRIPCVFHVHGSVASERDGEPIIGHCNSHEILKRRNLSSKAEENFDEGGTSIQNAIANYLESIYKDTDRLIQINASFFKQLKDVNQVVIIGWSAGDVDLP